MAVGLGTGVFVPLCIVYAAAAFVYNQCADARAYSRTMAWTSGLSLALVVCVVCCMRRPLAGYIPTDDTTDGWVRYVTIFPALACIALHVWSE